MPPVEAELEGSRPRLVDDIYIVRRSGRCLYLNSAAPDWHTVKNHYSFILDACDGETSVEAIQSMIQAMLPDEAELVTAQFGRMLQDSRIFAHNWQLPPQETGTEIDSTIPSLRFLYLTLTDDCNLRCAYCYAKDRAPVPTSSLEDWRRFVLQAHELASPLTVTFTGGEPLLAPFALDLAHFVHEQGSETVLITNGTQVRDLAQAARVADAFDLVRVSIDSLSESKSARLRGKGTLEAATRAYDLLLEAGANVQALVTVTKQNRDDIPELARRFGDRIGFQPLYKVGRARDDSGLGITGVQYFNALIQGGVEATTTASWGNIHGYRNNPYRKCAVAAQELSIGPDGCLFPCHMLHSPDFAVGNLRLQELSDLYSRSAVLDKFRRLDVDHLAKCRECPVRYFCGGACRARADISASTMTKGDRFCSFERNAVIRSLLHSFG